MAWGNELAYGVRRNKPWADPFREEREANVTTFTQPAPGYSGDGYDWIKQAISEAEIQRDRREREELQRAADVEDAILLSRQGSGTAERDEYVARVRRNQGAYGLEEATRQALGRYPQWQGREAELQERLAPLLEEEAGRAYDATRQQFGISPDRYEEEVKNYQERFGRYKQESPFFREFPEAQSREEAFGMWRQKYYGDIPELANYDPSQPIPYGRIDPLDSFRGEMRQAWFKDTEALAEHVYGFRDNRAQRLASVSPSALVGQGLNSALDAVGVPKGWGRDLATGIVAGATPWVLGGPVGGIIDAAMQAPLAYETAGGMGLGALGAQTAINMVPFGGGALRTLGVTGLNAAAAGGASAAFDIGAGREVDWEAAAKQAGIAGAIPLGIKARQGLPEAIARLPKPMQDAIAAAEPEIRNGAATYVVAKYVLDEDEDQALSYAAAAMGVTAVKNIPALRKFVTETLPDAIAVAQGRRGRGPAFGGMIEEEAIAAGRKWMPPVDGTSPAAALGLDPTGTYTPDDIKQAYRARMLDYHPDINVSDTATADAKAINDAYDRLRAGYVPPRAGGVDATDAHWEAEARERARSATPDDISADWEAKRQRAEEAAYKEAYRRYRKQHPGAPEEEAERAGWDAKYETRDAYDSARMDAEDQAAYNGRRYKMPPEPPPWGGGPSGPGTWHSPAGDDIPVTVTGYAGRGPDGRDYVYTDGGSGGIPADEVSLDDGAAPRRRPATDPYDMDEIIASARQQATAPRAAEAVIKQIPWVGRALAGIPNPASLFDTAQKKAVLVASIARENARRMFQNEWAIRKAQEVDEVLDPLMRDLGPRLKTPWGHLSLQDVGRAGAELAAPAIGYGAGEALGLSEDDKKRLLAAGLIGTASLSQLFTMGKFRAMEFQKAKYIGGATDPPPPKGVYGKLVDMIERPHLYNLDDLSPAARATIEPVIGAMTRLQEIRAQWVAEVNADRAAAGLKPVSLKDTNKMYHLWTQRSARKALGPKYDTGGYRPIPIGGFVGSGLERALPDTFAEALQQHPDLRIAGNADPRLLLRQQLLELGAMRSDALFAKALQDTPAAAQAIRSAQTQERVRAAVEAGDRDLARSLREQRRLERTHEAALRADGWRSIAGFGDGWLFSPDTQQAIEKLFIEGMKTESPVVRLLDAATTEIRQAAFVSDLSAWSLQGMMMVLESPGTALRNFVPLMGATLLGPRYTERWMLSHADLVRDFERAGGILQRETEGTEKGIRTLGDAPGIRSIEMRGFGAYLPIHRVLTFQNERNINSFIQHLPKPVRNVFGSDVALAGLNVAKYGGIGAAAYGLASQDDLSNWEKLIAIAAAGGVGALGAKYVEGKLGSQLYKKLNPFDQREVDIRAAKTANRTSGVFNKAQLGISNAQAQAERIFAFRSPALFRNMATIVKLAAFHPGPEGAQARFYLARTFFLTAAAMGGLRLAFGEDETFDPADPKSVLHPSNLSRANLGSAGKISPSNPYLSLVRAVAHKTPVEGHPQGGEWSLESMGHGLQDFLVGRAPDVVGPLFYQQYASPDSPGGQESGLKPIVNAAASLDPKQLVEEVGGRFIPVGVRDVAATGALDFLPGVDARDPNINTTAERALGAVVPVLGGNYSPETRPQERVRRYEEEIPKQFPGVTDSNNNGRIDLGDLDNRQRQQFNATPAGQEIKAFGEETNALRGPQEPSQIDIYLQSLAGARDAHVEVLQGLERAVVSGSLTKAQYREAYGEEQRRYLATKKEIERASERQYAQDKKPVFDPVTGESHAMSVAQYLNRSVKPNDKAIDDYYALFDKAVGPNNKIDFEKLETMQAAFRAGLPAEQRGYLDQHLADVKARGITNSKGEAVNLPTLQAYSALKEKAAPFWEVRDTEFAKLQQRDKFFQQFENYNDFRQQVRTLADANGIQEQDVIGLLSRRHRALKLFDRDVTRQQRKLRGADLDLDLGLQDFYGRPAVNWLAATARQYGDNRYDTYGPRLAPRPGPSRTEQIMFMRRYARQNPSARGSSLLAAFGV